jgi:hypothetical protein
VRGLGFSAIAKPTHLGTTPNKPVNETVKRARFSFEDGKR